MSFTRRPRRFAIDNPLFRRAYERERKLAPYELERRSMVAELRFQLNHDYRVWLAEHGIDPDTGRMSDAGVAFFKVLLDEDRFRKARERRAA